MDNLELANRRNAKVQRAYRHAIDVPLADALAAADRFRRCLADAVDRGLDDGADDRLRAERAELDGALDAALEAVRVARGQRTTRVNAVLAGDDPLPDAP